MESIKYIPNTNNRYLVSTTGKIYSCCDCHSGNSEEFKELSVRVKNNGYQHVTIHYADGTTRGEYVHRLVAQLFIPNPSKLPQVNHKDENKLNNSVLNLEWCTQEYNNNYGSHNKKSSEARVIHLELSELVELINAGATKRQISAHFNISKHTLRRRLREYNLYA